MSHLLDIVALVIVLACVIYAMRALLPRTVLARLIGSDSSTVPNKAGCGGCNSCDKTTKSTNNGCH